MKKSDCRHHRRLHNNSSNFAISNFIDRATNKALGKDKTGDKRTTGADILSTSTIVHKPYRSPLPILPSDTRPSPYRAHVRLQNVIFNAGASGFIRDSVIGTFWSVFFSTICSENVSKRVWSQRAAAKRAASEALLALRQWREGVEWGGGAPAGINSWDRRQLPEWCRGPGHVEPGQGLYRQVHGQQPGWFWLCHAGSYRTFLFKVARNI